jgi:hypothetical protein
LSTPTKARVAALICVLFIVWPGIHRGLVAGYDMNAWKLGGFAMYATPPARTGIFIVEVAKVGSQQKTLADRDLPSWLVQQRRLYSIRRSVLGLLLPPDALAEAYFRARPDVDQIEVVIAREMLSASTALMERQETVYGYDRPPDRTSPKSRR